MLEAAQRLARETHTPTLLQTDDSEEMLRLSLSKEHLIRLELFDMVVELVEHIRDFKDVRKDLSDIEEKLSDIRGIDAIDISEYAYLLTLVSNVKEKSY
jgi:hypothetical protein